MYSPLYFTIMVNTMATFGANSKIEKYGYYCNPSSKHNKCLLSAIFLGCYCRGIRITMHKLFEIFENNVGKLDKEPLTIEFNSYVANEANNKIAKFINEFSDAFRININFYNIANYYTDTYVCSLTCCKKSIKWSTDIDIALGNNHFYCIPIMCDNMFDINGNYNIYLTYKKMFDKWNEIWNKDIDKYVDKDLQRSNKNYKTNECDADADLEKALQESILYEQERVYMEKAKQESIKFEEKRKKRDQEENDKALAKKLYEDEMKQIQCDEQLAKKIADQQQQIRTDNVYAYTLNQQEQYQNLPQDLYRILPYLSHK